MVRMDLGDCGRRDGVFVQPRTSGSCCLFSSTSTMVNAQPPCRVHCPTPVRGSFSCEEQSSFRSSRHTETAVGMIPCQHWPEYWYEPTQLANSNSPTYFHRQGDCQENGPSQTPANYFPQANYYNSKWSPGDSEYVAVGNESNGGVVASVLALGIGCMLMCSMWAIVRLLPFLFVPVIFYYRRNGRNAFGSAWKFGEKVFRGNGAEGSPEPPKKLLIDNLSMEDVTLRERMTALESQNEQLLKELKKQREATQLLLKQKDIDSKVVEILCSSTTLPPGHVRPAEPSRKRR